MESKRLDESRHIELAQMIEFMEDDDKYLEKILNECGFGQSGDYERFRISMARYWLQGAHDYIESVVSTWLNKDGDKPTTENPYKDIPMTIVKSNEIVKVPDDPKSTGKVPQKAYTTVTDDKGKVSTAEVLPPKDEKKKEKSVGPQPIAKTPKPWVPSYKDEDKITAIIKEILEETPEDERFRPGFQGWLAGSATAALGGKTEPGLMLKIVGDVLATF